MKMFTTVYKDRLKAKQKTQSNRNTQYQKKTESRGNKTFTKTQTVKKGRLQKTRSNGIEKE